MTSSNRQLSVGSSVGWFTVAALLLCLAISAQSLWVDEGLTAWLAAPGDFHGLRAALTTIAGSSSQPLEPLYHVYLWMYAQVLGMKEWELRASNIPFALLLLAALSWTSELLSHRIRIWGLFAASPFLWFYMNEARPYIAMAACTAVSIAALLTYLAGGIQYRKAAPWACLSAFWLACSLSMLAIYAAAPLLLLTWLEMQRQKVEWRPFINDWQWPLLVYIPLFGALGIYSLVILHHGGYGILGRPGLANIAFAVYEFLGFSGLGPPRNDLRMLPILESVGAYWFWLSIGALAWLSVGALFLDLTISKQIGGLLRNLLVVLLIGFAFGIASSMALHHQFWGRHLTAVFPFFMLVIMQSLGAPFAHTRTKLKQRTALVLLAVAWGVSCFRLRFVTQYAKDDYRAATAEVLATSRLRGSKIVWLADAFTARYYGLASDNTSDLANALPATSFPILGRASQPQNLTHEQAAAYVGRSTSTIVLALSRPDLFDSNDAWRGLLVECGAAPIASLNAFRVYFLDPTKISPHSAARDCHSRAVNAE